MPETAFDCDGSRRQFDKLTSFLEQGKPSIVVWDDEQAWLKEYPLPGRSPAEAVLDLIVKEAEQAGHRRCLGKSACQIALGGQAEPASIET